MVHFKKIGDYVLTSTRLQNNISRNRTLHYHMLQTFLALPKLVEGT